MNTANPYKAGDLVSLRMSKCEVPDYRNWTAQDIVASPKITTKVVARYVVKVRGDTVFLRLDKRLQGISYRSVNRVY